MRIYKLLLSAVLGIALCLWFLTGVSADEPVIELEIVPGDEELNLVGPLGASTRFEDGFRLVARGGDLTSVNFVPTDLTGDDDVIPYWKITMEPATQPLPVDEAKTFKLVVTGWEEPGTYSGQLHILKPGEPSTQGLTIPIQLTAEASPEVVKVPDTAKLDSSLVRCASGLECWLAQRLLGPASTQTAREIRLSNESSVSALLQGAEVTDVTGQTGGYQLTAQDFEFAPADLDGWTLASKESEVLRVTVKTDRIPPDEYKGTIEIPVQDQDTPLSIDVDLKVRGGIFLPMVLIVGGWLLGHVIKLYPNAEKWALLRRLANQVEDNIGKIKNQTLKDEYTRDLKAVRDKINAGDLEGADKDLKELDIKVRKALKAQDEGRELNDVTNDEVQLSFMWVRKILGWLSGIAPEVEASFILWVLRPLLYLLLIAWIIYLGFQQRYIGQATFGANPVADYTGLVTWAMSADIVGRTVTKIGQAQ